MKYQIIGKNIEVTEGISNAIIKKLSRMDKYFLINDNVNCRAVVSAHVGIQKVEITIFIPKLTLRAEVENSDLYAAIDLAIDKLEGQIRKHKAKLKKYKTFAPVLSDTTDIVDEPEEKIVKRKILEIKPMDEEEAILQMELIDHDFFVFNNVNEGCISVLYKRKDGNYGIIDTK